MYKDKNTIKASLILENGRIFNGNAFGYKESNTIGEVVFNTSMTGYQEILTDPSYYGQMVVLTHPLIGNYGISSKNSESETPKVKGLIVREKSDSPSMSDCELTLDDYLSENKIPAIEGIDTRELTKTIRNYGSMKGIITTQDLFYTDVKKLFENLTNKDAVKNVSSKKIHTFDNSGTHVAVIDFGIKANILESFIKRKCKITLFPYSASAEKILQVKPDLIFLSNGPGDPMELTSVIKEIKKLIGVKPLCGICLGHQLLALALGGSTDKLKYGHRGGNHPVKDLRNNKVYITSQNHGYYVSKIPENTYVTHVSINDNTTEGIKHSFLPVMSVQYHPEASPGPHENDLIFDEFLTLAE